MGNPWVLFAVIVGMTLLTLWGVIYNIRKIFDDCPWRHDLLPRAVVEPLTPWPAAPAPLDLPQYVEKWVYWKLDKTGTPMCHFCDDPMGHPHTHLVRVPIPADVLACSEDIKNPAMCLVYTKSSKPTGPCAKQESEIPNAP